MKFLVIRFSAIGDIVLTSAVVRCLKKSYPDCTIHYLTKKQFLPLVEQNPNVDKCIILEKTLYQTFELLRKENYDVIIDLHKNLRTKILKGLLLRKNISFDKQNFNKWLFVNFKINRLPKIHLVDRYFLSLEKIDVKDDGQGLDFYTNASLSGDILSLLPSFPFGVLVIGGTYFTKKIPENKLLEIIKNARLPLVLIGGKDDTVIANRLAEKIEVVNLVGMLSIGESALVIQKSVTVISGDTGMMHIAAAFHKPITTIWGNTHPDFGFYAYLPAEFSHLRKDIQSDLSCRPCSKLGYNHCPKGHFNCMQSLDVSSISAI